MKLKLMNGSELAGFIKQRQLKQVRGIKQAYGINPKLVILRTLKDPSIDLYTRIKQSYGEDIELDVAVEFIKQAQIAGRIAELNADESVHGIVVQLPLENMSEADAVLDSIDPLKDIDGLGIASEYDSATATAIIWLLNGYNVEFRGKQIVLVGEGRLVGKPLREILEGMELKPEVLDINSEDIETTIAKADILITATGQPELIKSQWLKSGAVVVDAGVAVEDGVVKGDLEEAVYSREDLKITPKKGGVGPMTVAVLFDNLIRSAAKTID